MNLPKWNDPSLKAGTKVRTALWLVSEVGLGNSFTKEQHRSAFPRVIQADRRLRDLRPHGWVIHTKAEDLSLNAEEQRFIAMGDPIWESGFKSNSRRTGFSAKMRRTILAANDYQCATCGIAGGERYPDAPHLTAILSVSRRAVSLSDGKEEMLYLSECKLCASGFHGNQIDITELVESVNDLSSEERSLFAQWLLKGRLGGIDRLWTTFRRLPAEAKKAVRELLVSSGK